MSRLLETLSQETRQRLRGLCPAAEDINWPSELARARGWNVANPEYQAVQRDLGLQEMHALLGALSLTPRVSPVAARDLVISAVELYMVTEEFRVVSRTKNGELRLYCTRCPLYDRFLDQRWHGITACGCFARRRGWYAALGAGIVEELVMNRKWGDPVCQAIVHFPSLDTAGGPPSLIAREPTPAVDMPASLSGRADCGVPGCRGPCSF